MKKIGVFLIFGMVVFFQYCSSSKKASSAKVYVPFTYVTNVQPTVLANCSPCHIPPRGNKKALATYDSVKANIVDITRRINLNPTERGFMPFKHNKLSDSLINVFVQWKADGMLEK